MLHLLSHCVLHVWILISLFLFTVYGGAQIGMSGGMCGIYCLVMFCVFGRISDGDHYRNLDDGQTGVFQSQLWIPQLIECLMHLDGSNDLVELLFEAFGNWSSFGVGYLTWSPFLPSLMQLFLEVHLLICYVRLVLHLKSYCRYFVCLLLFCLCTK